MVREEQNTMPAILRANAAFGGFRNQPTQNALLALLNAQIPTNPSHIYRTTDAGVSFTRPNPESSVGY